MLEEFLRNYAIGAQVLVVASVFAFDEILVHT